MTNVRADDKPEYCNACRRVTLHRAAANLSHCIPCMMAPDPQANTRAERTHRSASPWTILGWLILIAILVPFATCVYVCGSAATAKKDPTTTTYP